VTAVHPRSGPGPADGLRPPPSAEPAGATPPPPEPAPSADSGAGDALPRLLKLAGGIIAPTSLLTGLLFHFGRLFDAGYFRFFRVNFTVLDLTTNDFLFAGVDGLFVPVAGATLGALLLLWLHRLLIRRLPETGRRRALRVLIPLAGISGAVLVGLAFAALLTGGVFAANSEAGGLCLAAGVLALTYAARLVRLAPRPSSAPARGRSDGSALAEWGAAFLLVSIGLFWAVGNYAFGVGHGRAVQLYAALPTQPEYVLYSARSLSLDVPGVREQRCADPDAAYRFRYAGLRLVRQAGDQYLLLPATWTPATGAALLISRSDAVRVEFRPPGLVPPTC
jgi:hypothetical protein